jgi:hypothetical protein
MMTSSASAVVGHSEIAVLGEIDFDARGVARNRFVHGVVQHLGEEVVHRLLVCSADIHTGTPAYGLEPFEYLDVGGGVGGFSALAGFGARSCLCGPDRLLLQLILELGE